MINCLLVENNSGNHDLQETVRKRVFSLHIGFCAEKNLRDHLIYSLPIFNKEIEAQQRDFLDLGFGFFPSL